MAGAANTALTAFDRATIPALDPQRLAGNGSEACVTTPHARLADWHVVAGTPPIASRLAIGAVLSALRRWQSRSIRVLHMDASRGIAVIAAESGRGAWILSESTQVPARQFFHCVRLLRESGVKVDRLHRGDSLELVD